MNLYAVKDLKSGKYGTPFIMENDMTATRSFLLSLADVTRPSVMTSYPADFELYHVGNYDDLRGVVVTVDTRFVSSAGSCADEFASMRASFVRLKESLGYNAISEKVKKNLASFKDEFLSLVKQKYVSDDVVLYDSFVEMFNECLNLHGLDIDDAGGVSDGH